MKIVHYLNTFLNTLYTGIAYLNALTLSIFIGSRDTITAMAELYSNLVLCYPFLIQCRPILTARRRFGTKASNWRQALGIGDNKRQPMTIDYQ